VSFPEFPPVAFPEFAPVAFPPVAFPEIVAAAAPPSTGVMETESSSLLRQRASMESERTAVQRIGAKMEIDHVAIEKRKLSMDVEHVASERKEASMELESVVETKSVTRSKDVLDAVVERPVTTVEVPSVEEPSGGTFDDDTKEKSVMDDLPASVSEAIVAGEAGAFWEIFASSEVASGAAAVLRRDSFVLSDLLNEEDVLEELAGSARDVVVLCVGGSVFSAHFNYVDGRGFVASPLCGVPDFVLQSSTSRRRLFSKRIRGIEHAGGGTGRHSSASGVEKRVLLQGFDTIGADAPRGADGVSEGEACSSEARLSTHWWGGVREFHGGARGKQLFACV
jgi:hypothetical protein